MPLYQGGQEKGFILENGTHVYCKIVEHVVTAGEAAGGAAAFTHGILGGITKIISYVYVYLAAGAQLQDINKSNTESGVTATGCTVSGFLTENNIIRFMIYYKL